MSYDELVKRLREPDKKCNDCSDKDNYDACLLCIDSLFKEAADAIEQLEEDVARAKEWESFWEEEANEALKKFQVAIASKPRWIPVTEFPPEGETYGDATGDTTFSVEVLGTEGFTYRKAYYNFKYKVWIDGNEEMEWPSITHWMPLPEPPKKET